MISFKHLTRARLGAGGLMIQPSVGARISTRRWRLAAGVTASVAVAAALALIASGPAAHASHTRRVSTYVASTCTPDEASAGRYDVHVGDFKHKGTSVGQIVTRCNVTVPEFGGGAQQLMQVLYRDQDGRGTQQRVTVDLIQSDDAGLTRILSHFDSNAHLGGPNNVSWTVPYNHHFNFEFSAYYLDIRVTRSVTSTFPLASTVRLTSR